jgi:hypothetical protein
MTVDIARMDANALAVTSGANDALARLANWVEAARNAHQLVAPLVGTAFIPDAYKPKVDPRATPEQRAEAHATAIANATAAVLQGITLGLDPMTALQQIYVVHGRPGLYARVMVALVQAHGHEVWTEDISDSRAVLCGRRRGTEAVERVTVTMEQARKAGWTSNAAYTKTPQDMLWARAAARVCNRVAADVLMGITSVEEIQDDIKVQAEVGTRTVTPRRRAAAITPGPDEEPSLEDETPAPAPHTSPSAPSGTRGDQPAPDSNVAAQGPADRPVGTITGAQQRMLHALLRDTDRSDRDVALVFIAGVLGRELESTKELSKADAARVIDVLQTEMTESAPADDESEPSLLDDEPA